MTAIPGDHPLSRPARAFVTALLVGCGFCLAWGLSSLLPDGPFLRTWQKRSEFLRYALFDPTRADQPKHVLLGACNIVYNAVGTNEEGKYITHGVAQLGQLIDFLLRNEYDTDEAFYDAGASGTGYTEHLWYFYHILRARGLKTLVYANIPGGMDHFYDRRQFLILESLRALELLHEDWPAARADIERYVAALKASPAYAHAIAQHGEDWRTRIDPDLLLLPPEMGKHPLPASPTLQRLALARDALLRRSTLLSLSEDRAWDRITREKLDWLAARYPDNLLLPVPDRLGAKKAFFNQQQELTETWLRIVSTICQERGVRLVWYYHPMLGSKEAYASVWRPEMVQGLGGVLETLGTVTIDATVDHDLCQFDFCWGQETRVAGGENKAYRYRYAHVPNIIGNYKRARRTIAAMRAAGLLDATPRPGAVAWQDAQSLPDTCSAPVTFGTPW